MYPALCCVVLYKYSLSSRLYIGHGECMGVDAGGGEI